MQLGRIFEIREFCLHDGPGPRTTVFLQGCPLRCRWCQNPEGLDFNGGEERSAESIAAEIAKTGEFLVSSGGGVTFSGGEPLHQPEFVLAIMQQIRVYFPTMHFAIETSGFAEEMVYRKVIGEMDLVLQDLKLPNVEEYRTWTKISADIIFANIAWLKQSGKHHIIRIPTMPGVNDSEAAKREFANLLEGDVDLVRVELLPYNLLAGAKYSKLGQTYSPGFDEKVLPDLSISCFEKKSIRACKM